MVRDWREDPECCRHLRTEDEAGEPGGLLVRDGEELVITLLIEALRRDPHLCFRMYLWRFAVCFSRRARSSFGGVSPGSPPGTKMALSFGSLRKTSAHSLRAKSLVFGSE